MNRAVPSTLLLLLLSCAGEEPGVTLTVEYQLFKRDVNLACSGAPEVDEIEVTLFNTNGTTPRTGWPRKATCTGSFTAEVEPGAYVVQVVALGELQGDPAAALYQARADLTLPTGAPIALSLEPQVAFLDLAWTFGDEMLAPCDTEVDSIDVLVSGGGAAPWTARYLCTDTPIQIDAPFSLQSYTIQVTANSSEGFPLFTSDVQRTLDRGLNDHVAVLEPRGGQVQIDFEFLVGGVSTRACDAPEVSASQMTALINNLEGGAPVSEAFSCMEERPYTFTSARFTQGRSLELALTTDGAEHRFKGIQRFIMPSGDYFSGVMTMVPVGGAVLAVEVASSTCAGDVERFDVEIRAAAGGSGPVLLEAVIEPPDTEAQISDLPYGTYSVTVEERVGGAVKCTLEEQRTLTARDNDWDRFVF